MIFIREFKRNFKGLIIWSVVLGGLVLMMMSIYPQFSIDSKSMNEFMKAYPEALRKAFSMDKLDMSTMIGFYGIEVYLMKTLIGTIYASILGSGLIAKEQNDKTVEFLLSQPVTRFNVITGKLLLLLTNIVILNLVCFLISIISFGFTKDEQVPMNTFYVLSAGALILDLTFGTVSFLLSSIMKKTRNIVSVSMGIVFVSYFFNVMSGVSDKYKNLKYFSPFKYVDSGDIIEKGSIDLMYIFILVSIMVISIVGSYVVYCRKDIV